VRLWVMLICKSRETTGSLRTRRRITPFSRGLCASCLGRSRLTLSLPMVGASTCFSWRRVAGWLVGRRGGGWCTEVLGNRNWSCGGYQPAFLTEWDVETYMRSNGKTESVSTWGAPQDIATSSCWLYSPVCLSASIVGRPCMFEPRSG
jgi:hypothetical protein